MITNELTSYIYNLGKYVEYLADKVENLEKQLKNMETDISDLKKQKGTHIDKIEYKFDQLKVETLSGALHIGLVAKSSKEIEDLVLTEMKKDTDD